MDLFLTICFWIVQGGMAALGAYVSLKPQPKERHLVLIIAFVALFLLGGGINIIQTKRASDAQTKLQAQLDRIEKKPEPTPQVTVNVPPQVPPNVFVSQAPQTPQGRDTSGDVMSKVEVINTELKPGTQLAFNLKLLSRSPLPVDGLIHYFAAAAGPIPNVNNWESEEDEKVDREVFARFHKASVKEWQAIKPGQPRISIETGKGVYNTVAFGFATQEDVDNVMKGKVRLYAYIRARWKGSSRELEECEWMQPPSTTVFQDDRIVWHACIR
jgi:hypothetical protein